jgi:hypothetical protein
VCGGECRLTVFLPLRRLTDEELRVHASQLFDAACGIHGDGSVWVVSLRNGRVDTPFLGRGLSGAFGRRLDVRFWSLECAEAAGKIGHRGAVRALCEVARRAGRGSYGATESQLSVSAQGLDFTEFATESQTVARLPRGSSRAGVPR